MHVFSRHQFLDEFGWARCGADGDPRIGPEAQSELRLVPRIAPGTGAQLIASEKGVLWTAKSISFFRRVERHQGSIRPRHPAFRWFIGGPVPRRADRKQPAFALTHDVASIGGGAGDEPTAAMAGLDLRPDPFREAPGLAPASARKNEPDAPVARGWKLLRPCPEFPGVCERR